MTEKKTNRRNKSEGKPETSFWTKDENGNHELDERIESAFIKAVNKFKTDGQKFINYLRDVYTAMTNEAIQKNIAGQVMAEIDMRVLNSLMTPENNPPINTKILFDFTVKNADRGIIFIRPKYQSKTETELKTA